MTNTNQFLAEPTTIHIAVDNGDVLDVDAPAGVHLGSFIAAFVPLLKALGNDVVLDDIQINDRGNE